MQEFDIIIIGSGSGLNVASEAAEMGLSVAVIDPTPMGGTCLNRGCIPSKFLIHRADVAETIRRSSEFGITSKIQKINFPKITSLAYNEITRDALNIEKGISQTKNMTLFKEWCKFSGERTLKVGNKQIRGKKIIIAAGTRPMIPKINGIHKVSHYTSDDVMFIKKLPKSMIILGGSFIATELAHFFGSMGTKITIVQRSKLLNREDGEIADVFTKIISKKYNVLLGYETDSVSQKGKVISLTIKNKKGSTKKLRADALLVATGRIPNTDLLDVKKGGIETDERGFVKVDDYLETCAENVWALGDIVGKYLLKHSANLESQYVINNALGNEKKKVDYWPMPHAVFSSPQIASVGYTEEELKDMGKKYAVGKYEYEHTGMGLALNEKDGFVKILADKNSHQILGCHIIGPEASSIIHEVIVAMRLNATVEQLVRAVHIHPALSEVVQRAAANVEF